MTRVLIALILASLTAQSMPGAKRSKIATIDSGSWALDQNGSNGWDGTVIDGLYFWDTLPAGVPVYGDWNGDGTTKMGVYSNGTWYLDYDGNGIWEEGVDKRYVLGDSNYSVPVVGDWSGNGRTKIGAYSPSAGSFMLDQDGDGAWTAGGADIIVTWSGSTLLETPVIGDWNGDGKANPFRPGRVWSLYFSRIGLGSHVSTCEGPPPAKI